MSLASERASILGSLLSERQRILGGTGRGEVLGSLAAERARILSSTKGGSTLPDERKGILDSLQKEREGVLGSLAAERSKVFSGVRGNNAGPMTFLRKAPVDTYAAEQAKDPWRAALERKYAQANADAQTQANEASLSYGGDVIFGSPKQTMARMNRQYLMRKAAEEYNAALAPNDPRRKDLMISTRWGA